jgi:regulator of protease activity HflC (stomatin/prohibitin superfamily)
MNLTIIAIIIIFLLIYDGFFTVEQQRVAIVQRFGKFVKIASPGLNLKIPLIDKVAGDVSLRVNQLDVKVETKTEDNVFLHVIVSVQFFIHPEKVYEAFYKLQDPSKQITSFVFDVVRARVPAIKLDDVFERKDDIAIAVKSELEQVMDDFGYGIIKTLVTDIDPDQRVKESMNEINAAQRMRVAANEKGEAEKILKVKAAEAEAESKALQGRGMANQRKAIIQGLKESVTDFKESLPDSTEQDILNLVMITQYFDTIKDLGASSSTNTILIPHSPSSVADIMDQIRNSVITANQVGSSNSKNLTK